MAQRGSVDAVVVGAGPNGLTAAITLARAGLEVEVHEAAETVGGGARTEELTAPGFRHDVCSAVHPLAAASPAFASMPLAEHGLEWLETDLALAHPLPDRPAATLARSVETTAASLGAGADAYRRLVGPLARRWDDLAGDVLRPVTAGLPRHPLLLARFGLAALSSPRRLAHRLGGPASAGAALLAGVAAHSGAPLGAPVTSGIGLTLILAGHAVGWPVPRGGSQAVADALSASLRSLGGRIVTGHHVRSLGELPEARAYLLDVAPANVATLGGGRLPGRYLARLARNRPGPGVFKLDYALTEPVPWSDPACRRAGTVHVGGHLDAVDASLAAAERGTAPERPFLVTAQPSLVDPGRAPSGHHTFWAYAHVPHGWDGDLTEAVEDQLERFAPGFRDVVAHRAVAGPRDLEARNPNLVGGDIGGGAVRGLQALFRPLVAWHPHATPDPAVFLCSSATPPGPGVHGMCGHHAARLALRRRFDRDLAPPEPPAAR